jgi:chromate reductase
MNISIISGSPRKNSNSLRLAKALQRLSVQGGHEAAVIDFSTYDIPLMVHGKVDPGNLTAFQNNLKNAFENASLIFLVSPEYNWLPSAELVNFFHQMGDKPFANMWKDKVFAVAGVSNGRGGRFPCVQIGYVLNKICGFMGFESVVSPRNFESHFTPAVLDENGNSLGNDEFDQGLERFWSFAYKLNQKFTG